jgi:8-oxo-dGTP pyrophosphatase MutT (NUDIX family)
METASRPAVRIVCLDANGRVLMLRWQDPHDGSYLWEPPGGGIEAGESPYEAARRELTEETGLDADAIMETPVVVPRDTVWNGKRFIGPETFFVAHFALTEPPLSRLGLLQDEVENLRAHAWLSRAELSGLGERLEPPELPSVIAELDPRGPWA